MQTIPHNVQTKEEIQSVINSMTLSQRKWFRKNRSHIANLITRISFEVDCGIADICIWLTFSDGENRFEKHSISQRGKYYSLDV